MASHLFENMVFSVLSIAKCLLDTICDICDTQENERRFDDAMKWTKSFHKDVDFGMRLGDLHLLGSNNLINLSYEYP